MQLVKQDVTAAQCTVAWGFYMYLFLSIYYYMFLCVSLYVLVTFCKPNFPLGTLKTFQFYSQILPERHYTPSALNPMNLMNLMNPMNLMNLMNPMNPMNLMNPAPVKS